MAVAWLAKTAIEAALHLLDYRGSVGFDGVRYFRQHPVRNNCHNCPVSKLLVGSLVVAKQCLVVATKPVIGKADGLVVSLDLLNQLPMLVDGALVLSFGVPHRVAIEASPFKLPPHLLAKRGRQQSVRIPAEAVVKLLCPLNRVTRQKHALAWEHG